MATDTHHPAGKDTWHRPTLYAALTLILGAAVIAIVFMLSVPGKFDISARPPPLRNTPEPEIRLDPYALAVPHDAIKDPPTSPARRHYVQSRPGDYAGRSQPGSGEAADPTPGTLPSGEFRSAVENGRKVFLPNPAGKCDLVGSTGAPMTQALDDCFAGKSASR
jgi:hypothetical protein